MPGRTVEDILKDWRAAEADLPADGSTPDLDLIERIEVLRAEHAVAMAEREADAQELGRTPGLMDTTASGT